MLKDGDSGAVVQRDGVTYAVAPHTPAGLVTPDLLRKLADVADELGAQALKITGAQRLALIGLTEDQVSLAWERLGMQPGGLYGDIVRSVKVCAGMQFCKRAQQDSMELGLTIDERYHGRELPGKMKIGVSGCGHSCSESAVKDIGLIGTKAGWTLMIGGAAGGAPRLATTVARKLSTQEALELVDRFVSFFAQHGIPKERIGRTLDRLGAEATIRWILEGEGDLPPQSAEVPRAMDQSA